MRARTLRVRGQLACAIVALVACACRASAPKEPAAEVTGRAVFDAGFAGVFPASAAPFAAEGPMTFGPGFARRVYRTDKKRVEITVARLGKEPGAYERWLANSADYPQAPLPSEANGFFTCSASDRIAGCDLHIQTRSGFHVEIMGDGHVSRDELIALLSHLRLADLSDSFPPLL